MKKLTGEIRFRANWRGKLVFQVEEAIERSAWDGFGISRWTERKWRDANVRDVSQRLLVQAFIG